MELTEKEMMYVLNDIRATNAAIKDQKMHAERNKWELKRIKSNDYVDRMYIKKIVEIFDNYFKTGIFDGTKFSECKIKLAKYDGFGTTWTISKLHKLKFDSMKGRTRDKEKIYNKRGNKISLIEDIVIIDEYYGDEDEKTIDIRDQSYSRSSRIEEVNYDI